MPLDITPKPTGLIPLDFPEHFEAMDIKKILGIDKNKLFYWINTYQLFKPEIEMASGTGSRSKFSCKNLFEIATVKKLLGFGFDLKAVKQTMKKLDKQNIFSNILASRFGADATIYIYRKGSKVYLERWDTKWMGATEKPKFSYKIGEKKPGGSYYLSIQFNIGWLASCVINDAVQYLKEKE